jgi:hypothetical protein
VDKTEKGAKQPPKPAPETTVEEVRGPQYVQVDTNELAPSHSLLALRRRREAVNSQPVQFILYSNACALYKPSIKRLQNILSLICYLYKYHMTLGQKNCLGETQSKPLNVMDF